MARPNQIPVKRLSAFLFPDWDSDYSCNWGIDIIFNIFACVPNFYGIFDNQSIRPNNPSSFSKHSGCRIKFDNFQLVYAIRQNMQLLLVTLFWIPVMEGGDGASTS
jgi:hypothetical protein